MCGTMGQVKSVHGAGQPNGAFECVEKWFSIEIPGVDISLVIARGPKYLVVDS